MQFFSNLNQREKWLLYGVLPLVVLVLFYLYLWQPSWQQLQQLRQVVPEKTATLKWMHYRLADISGDNLPASSASEGPLLTEIERLAISANVNAAIQRVQPGSDSSVEIWFQEVAADQLLGWVDALAAARISVQSATVTRVTEGQVAARIKLQRLGADES